jgi:hypothetical protein
VPEEWGRRVVTRTQHQWTWRAAPGGIIRPSVALKYQLGFVRQAASVIDVPSASTPCRTCESAAGSMAPILCVRLARPIIRSDIPARACAGNRSSAPIGRALAGVAEAPSCP